MYRDDYIMRMIARLGQIIAYLTGLRQQGRYPLALIAIDDAYRNTLGIGAEAIAGLSEREILALIRFAERDEAWRDLAAYVAALLYAEAEIYAAQQMPEQSAGRALRGLQLLLECELAEGDLPAYTPDREHLLALLAAYELPAHTGAALLTLYEREGDFAAAEDALFDMLAAHPTQPAALTAGLAFYDRLLALGDGDLERGGLPRPEVLAGRAELAARVAG